MLKVTCALIIENGKVLIAQNNSNSDNAFQWEFPGGKIKTNETSHDCIVREIMEELDVSIKIIKKMQAIIWEYDCKTIQLIPFLCKIISGNIQLKEHVQSLWIDIDSLNYVDFSAADKALIDSPYNQKILEKYLRKNMNDTR